MHPKQIEPRKYTIIMDDKVIGEFATGGEIETKGLIILDSEYDEYVVAEDFHRDRTFEVSFKMKSNRKLLRTILHGTNNWRKLHGLPMIRGWKE